MLRQQASRLHGSGLRMRSEVCTTLLVPPCVCACVRARARVCVGGERAGAGGQWGEVGQGWGEITAECKAHAPFVPVRASAPRKATLGSLPRVAFRYRQAVSMDPRAC